MSKIHIHHKKIVSVTYPDNINKPTSRHTIDAGGPSPYASTLPQPYFGSTSIESTDHRPTSTPRPKSRPNIRVPYSTIIKNRDGKVRPNDIKIKYT
jgi:hypothetical protein